MGNILLSFLLSSSSLLLLLFSKRVTSPSLFLFLSLSLSLFLSINFAGMGTEVQSEMYMPCYYSLRDLNDNTGNGSWSLHQQNSMLGIGQYHDFCLTRPAIDVNDHSDREQLRQTILTHESVFRHQVFISQIFLLYDKVRFVEY